jgi:toxin ParE1/3/4
MKPRIVKWPRVAGDLIGHFAYIAQDKFEPAERRLIVAEESFERIGRVPSIGTAWKSKRPQLRGIRFYPMPAPYRSYVIFYRQITDGVEIMAVLHGARDLKNALRDVVE